MTINSSLALVTLLLTMSSSVASPPGSTRNDADALARTTGAVVSPATGTGTAAGATTLFATNRVTELDATQFDPETLDLIVELICPGSADKEGLKKALGDLFSDKWFVTGWADLMVFTSMDVTEALVHGTDLATPVIIKKLGYVVDFAGIATLTPDVTMNDIVKKVTMSKTKTFAVPDTPGSPPRNRTVQVFDKKTVPTLEKFSGHDEDYFAWREATINVMGTAGFGRFLDDPGMTDKHPELAESVFYALRGAVHGGQAQSIAQGMLDNKEVDPVPLWLALEDYYDTTLNRANVVLFDIRRVLNLRLDGTGTATKFISEFRECLQRLRKNKARLADDTDTLRALLLVAIQDDDFDNVRDAIVHKPEGSVESILTEIRERETALMMKDQASKVSGDGTSSTRYSRRTNNQGNNGSGHGYGNRTKFNNGYQKTGSTPGNRPGPSTNGTTRQWSIPRFPDSWKQALGAPLFKVLLDWRGAAHGGHTQKQLDAEFATVVEKFRPGTGGGKTKSRRTSKSGTGGDDGAEQDSDGGDSTSRNHKNESGTKTESPRKRIRLLKSRRVITERSA